MSATRCVRGGAAAALTVLALSLAGCGSGSGGTGTATTTGSGETTTPTVNNVQPIIVDNGPTTLPAGYNVDAAFTTVTICVPGTTTCQSIDHVLVDTGSTGLRVLSSVLTLNLPLSTTSAGAPVGNCIQYADNSYQWGPVALADVTLAGEVASSVPIQISGEAGFAAAPSGCTSGGTAVDTVLALGANGLLGVGNYRQDCGAACASASTNPGIYFDCSATPCVATTASLTNQLQNPVWMFPQDNNGLAIVLPQISASGQATVSGSMIFGIGTQTNNALGSAKAQALDDFGNFTTTFNGVAYSTSYIDSGSNGYYFLTSTETGLPECTGQLSGWYCPSAPASLTAITTGPNPNGGSVAVSQNVAFSIANANTLFSTGNIALNNLGGTNPGIFDWGLPFFFGRTVFIGIESQVSTVGVGPYWAY